MPVRSFQWCKKGQDLSSDSHLFSYYVSILTILTKKTVSNMFTHTRTHVTNQSFYHINKVLVSKHFTRSKIKLMVLFPPHNYQQRCTLDTIIVPSVNCNNVTLIFQSENMYPLSVQTVCSRSLCYGRAGNINSFLETSQLTSQKLRIRNKIGSCRICMEKVNN